MPKITLDKLVQRLGVIADRNELREYMYACGESTDIITHKYYNYSLLNRRICLLELIYPQARVPYLSITGKVRIVTELREVGRILCLK